MHLRWEPNPDTVENAEMAGVPRWAEPPIRRSFIGHFQQSADECTSADWNQRYSKWLLRDWRNPQTRPTKPANDDAAAYIFDEATGQLT